MRGRLCRFPVLACRGPQMASWRRNQVSPSVREQSLGREQRGCCGPCCVTKPYKEAAPAETLGSPLAAGPSPAECSSACVPRSESTGEERTKTNFFPRQGVEKTHLGRSGSRQVKNKLRIAFYGSGEEGLPRSGEHVLGIDVRVSRGPASAAHAPATQKPKPNNPVDLVVRPTLSILLVKTDEACVHVCV